MNRLEFYIVLAGVWIVATTGSVSQSLGASSQILFNPPFPLPGGTVEVTITRPGGGSPLTVTTNLVGVVPVPAMIGAAEVEKLQISIPDLDVAATKELKIYLSDGMTTQDYSAPFNPMRVRVVDFDNYNPHQNGDHWDVSGIIILTESPLETTQIALTYPKLDSVSTGIIYDTILLPISRNQIEVDFAFSSQLIFGHKYEVSAVVANTSQAPKVSQFYAN